MFMRKPFRIHVSTISKSHRVAPSSTSTDVSCGRFASSPSTPGLPLPTANRQTLSGLHFNWLLSYTIDQTYGVKNSSGAGSCS